MPEISRRHVLAGAGVAAGLSTLPLAFTTPRAEAAPRTAIVIGSGFGGAVAALRLGKAGVRTTVFERGRLGRSARTATPSAPSTDPTGAPPTSRATRSSTRSPTPFPSPASRG